MGMPHAVPAHEFFALKLEGGSITDAQRATGIGYSTLRLFAAGTARRNVAFAESLQAWSKTVPAARKRGVRIGAIETLGLR